VKPWLPGVVRVGSGAFVGVTVTVDVLVSVLGIFVAVLVLVNGIGERVAVEVSINGAAT
jgi:hypothetical protein